jgi:hypothetical protein
MADRTNWTMHYGTTTPRDEFRRLYGRQRMYANLRGWGWVLIAAATPEMTDALRSTMKARGWVNGCNQYRRGNPDRYRDRTA